MTDRSADLAASGQSGDAGQAGRGWIAYLVAMALLTGGYMLAGLWGPTWLHSGLVFNLLGGASVAGLLIGARANAPKRRLPWYLLAIGQTMFVVSDVLAYNYERLFGSALSFPSVADSFHLAFYPFLVGGMLLLIHERDESRDRSALIDALTVTLALATLLWVYLISPYANDHTMSAFRRLASIGYPAMDILVVGVIARMAAGSHRREPAFAFMLLAAAVLLVSDVLFGWRLLEGHFTPGAATTAGWAVFYALLGASAMHPSMRQLSEPGAQGGLRLTRARLAVLACASLTVPVVIVVRQALGEQVDLYVLIGASAAMFSLVLMRMSGIVHRHEEVTSREAALRIALTEQELKQRSEDRLSSLIKNSSDVVCVVGPDADVRYVSPSIEQMFGQDPAAIENLVDVLHPDDVQRVRALIATIASQPATQGSVAEFRVRHAGHEEWRDAEALGANQMGDGAIEGVVLNIRDISERKASRTNWSTRPSMTPSRGFRTGRCFATASSTPSSAAVGTTCRWRSCSSMWTTSSTSTTASAMRPETRCCRRSVGVWRTACGRSTPPPGSVGTSSRS